jgi:hypothetical protein
MGHEGFSDSVQEVISILPDYHDGERREHALTKADALLVAQLIRVSIQGTPAMNLTESQVTSINAMIKERRKILALVGTATVTLFAWVGEKLLNAIDPNFWCKASHFICGNGWR